MAALLLGLAAPGCGEDSEENPSDGTTADGTTDGANGGDGSSDASEDTGPDLSQWMVTSESDDYRIAYVYAQRSGDENELWLMDPDGAGQQQLTELADLENQDPPVSCEWGCTLSDDVKWMAIAVGPPEAQGRDFRIGQFDRNLEFRLIKDLVLEDKVDFKFAGDRLYYSELKSEVGCLVCQYDVSFIDLTTQQTTKILTFPPDTDLEQSTYRGHFKVAKDGSALVLLNTTIRSVGVYLWKDGVGLSQLDFLCEAGTQGNCMGNGSQYRDIDPVAISNDGTKVVFFTFSDRFQRARLYDATDPSKAPSLAVLGSVPVGEWIENVCDEKARTVVPEWQWQRVVGNPVFTPDDSEVVFLAEDACPDPNTGNPPGKAQRNFIRIKTDTIASGKTIDEADIWNVTQHPMGDVTDNVFITGYRLSYDGNTIIYTGTPRLTQNGTVMDDGAARQRNDREVYRIRLDGENREQLTNNPAREAGNPLVVPAE